MWGRKRKVRGAERRRAAVAAEEAMHQARVEAAERTSVVVDLRDAEVARLELLNEALDPLFAEIPAEVDLFDRGISRGETPRLWIDAVAHVAMGRDKRAYRFLHDSRIGRHVLAESHEIAGYRAGGDHLCRAPPGRTAAGARRRSRSHCTRRRATRPSVTAAAGAGARSACSLLGFLLGVVALFAVARADRDAVPKTRTSALDFADHAVRAALPRDHFAAPVAGCAVDA